MGCGLIAVGRWPWARLARCLVLLVLSLLLTGAGGCAAAGFVAYALGGDDKDRAPVEYDGLKNQTCAVMVWVDRGVRVDYASIQPDVAKILQDRLAEGQTKKKVKELEKAQFIDPRSVLRYQRDHPESDGLPITEVAPRLNVSRVIYVEVEQFETRSPTSLELLRGSATCTLRVVEVADDGKAKLALEQSGIQVVFPPKSEGVPPTEGVDTAAIYRGTVLAMAHELSKYFHVYDE